MEFKFENLIIWQKAMDFAEEINAIAYSFRKQNFIISLLKSDEQLIPLP
ncbi:four helix bundle protein [Maribellus sp. CM-23]|nr:four helix bundle protein [Maribellus sp. CM-23]